MNPELLDILAGRHCCRCTSDHFPLDGGAIRMNAFCIDGGMMWEVWLHKYFWNEVRLGNIGLDPQLLFRPRYVN
jgi:hypothetical protein